MFKKLLVRRNIIVSVVVVALSILAFRSYYLSQRPKFETVEVKKASLTQIITASGEIKSDNEIELKFPISGKLTAVNVKVNDLVNKGQVLALLDTQALRIALQQARNDWLAKDATAKKTEDDVKDHDKDETFTQRETRIKAQVARDSAYDAVKAAQRAFQDAVLTAPFSGVVTKLHTHEGTSIINTTPIVTIADPDKIAFIAKIGEADITNVTVNQEAIVILDAFEGREFKGKVTEIDYAATTSTNGGGKIYQVKITLDELNKVKLDMSGDVEIVTVSHQDALVIPRIAVQEKNGKKYAEVLDGEDLKQKEITAGIKGIGGIIEVLTGLGEGEKVIIPTPNK